MRFKGYYDIVLGDVGRLAAVRCMQVMTEHETLTLQSISSNNNGIFDEMRRIMFVLCCEIEWLKRQSIQREFNTNGRVTKNILIGIGDESVKREFIASGVVLVRSLLVSAEKRGYQSIRVYVPCNGLSDILREIVGLCAHELVTLFGSVTQVDRSTFRFENGTSVVCESVPERVSDQIVNVMNASSALIIGTSGVNSIYRRHLSNSSVGLFEISDAEYELVNDAIVSAISNDKEGIFSAREKLRTGLIKRYLEYDPKGVIVEGCTDFDFKLGISSLTIFAEALVADAYR